jgi:hypothetical protein
MSREMLPEIDAILNLPFPENIVNFTKILSKGNSRGERFKLNDLELYDIKTLSGKVFDIFDKNHKLATKNELTSSSLKQFFSAVSNVYSRDDEYKSEFFGRELMLPTLELALQSKNHELSELIIKTTKSIATRESNVFQFIEHDDLESLSSVLRALQEVLEYSPQSGLPNILTLVLIEHEKSEYFHDWLRLCHQHLPKFMSDIYYSKLLISCTQSFSHKSLSALYEYIPNGTLYNFEIPNKFHNLDAAEITANDVIATIDTALGLFENVVTDSYFRSVKHEFVGLFNSFGLSDRHEINEALSKHELVSIPIFYNLLNQITKDVYRSFEVNDLLDSILSDGSLIYCPNDENELHQDASLSL